MKKKIGIVSCDEWKNKIKEDLMLQRELLQDGYITEIISWQDETVNYSEYECLILRSVWGYQDHYPQFKKWLLSLKENNIPIYNNVDIILDNIRKDKQFEILDKYSIPHIPTTFIKQSDEIKRIYEYDKKFVVKPLISGSGKNTYMITPAFKGEFPIKDTIIQSCISIVNQEENGLMLQPFIPSIKNGEYSCIFIDGINTHNMLRFPGIFAEKKHAIYLPTIPFDVINLANNVSQIPEFNNYLYMRIDIVVENNMPYIMEVELAEPDLLIKYIADENIKQNTLKTFAKKIERRM